MKRLLIATSLLLAACSGYAQKNVTLSIAHKLAGNTFAFGQAVQNDLGQDFYLSRVDYYISGIEIIHDGGTTTAVPGKYILAKASQNVNEALGSFDLTKVEGIRFSIGVDASLNHEDPSLQPEESPLYYQTPSMHWGWAPGYRFAALEGEAGSGLSARFELHGLEDKNYFQQTVMTEGVEDEQGITIQLDADYAEAVRGINLAAGPIAHGFNAEDLTMLENFKNYVFKASGAATRVKNPGQEVAVSIYPNPGKGSFYLQSTITGNALSSYVLTDVSGRRIEQNSIAANGMIHVQNPVPGMYFLTLYRNGTPVSVQKIIIEQ